MDQPRQIDLWSLYRQMLRSRLYERAVTALWQEGLISGEMHAGMGEEAVVAGVLDHLREGDAMALDHRGTPPMLMRGVDPVLLLRECLGRQDGLCGGMGGHMHLLSPEHLAASSGIVGASGPVAAGFALAAHMLRPGTLSVAFFGEGAMNQGMLMEAIHLSAVWRLPALFVCKDDGWAITTRSPTVTAGNLVERARSLGVEGASVDGSDVRAVWEAAREATGRIRNRGAPFFLHARCVHLEAHMLGLQLGRVARRPVSELSKIAGPMVRSIARKKGASLEERAGGLTFVLSTIRAMRASLSSDDPVARVRRELEDEHDRLHELEQSTRHEIAQIVERALAPKQSDERETV